jgi:hypothetical protein
MGVDNSPLLNSSESAYFNVIFKDNLKGFDFTEKKVGFIYNGAKSNKQEYFKLEKDRFNRNYTPNNGSLYIFNADPNGIISVGPNRYTDADGNWHWMEGTNKWDTHSKVGETVWRHTLRVNKNTINKYANWLNTLEQKGKLVYSVELSSCVTHTSIALNLSGIFNIGIHPYLLNAQMYLWNNGIRPWTFSYLLNQ